MKRPPGIWLLLSAGVLWLSIQNVYGLKATELIFGKTTTTTTTTEVPAEGEHKDGMCQYNCAGTRRQRGSVREGQTRLAVCRSVRVHPYFQPARTALIFHPHSYIGTSVSTEASGESENSIKSNLTGNPQIDYIYDPNLPRELNGYNLSSYPFYNSMPKDIVFKCDGLHDGFYASVPHKCQVYHQCLFGARYDFLCANYTAFDQKTFICHFVSEVDCVNSRDYWHRNDALYVTASTTTAKPVPVVISPALTAAPRRPAPGLRRRKPLRRRPQYEYYDDEYDDEREDDYEEPPPRRRRKRPRPRPRPIYEDDYEDYEDDRYERRGPSRRTEDDDRKPYDSKEPDDRRRTDSDRKQHNIRDDRRESNDRRTDGDDDKKPIDKKESDGRRNRDDDRKPLDKKETDDGRSGHDERKPYDRRESDDRRSDDDRKPHDRREYDDRRYEDRPSDSRRYKEDRRRDYDDRVRYDKDEEDYRYDRDRKRRPDDELVDERDDRRSPPDKRPLSDRRNEKRRPANGSGLYDRPRKGHRRPHDDDLYEDDREDDRRPYNRPRKNDNRDDPPSHDAKRATDIDEAPAVKPSSGGSVFNQPRMPPKIRPPVLKNEQNKFSSKPAAEKPVLQKPEDEEDFYEYEDETLPPRPTPRSNRKPEPEASETRRPNKPISLEERRDSRKPLASASRPRIQMSRRPIADPIDDYEEEKISARPHTRPRHDLDSRDSKVSTNSRNRPAVDEDVSNTERENGKSLLPKHSANNKERTTSQLLPKFVPKEHRGRVDFRDKSKIETTTSSTTTTSTTTATTTTTTKEPPRQRSEPVVKVVKRPFLPSRGGNPYSARGLQPVGAKALENSRNSPPTEQETDISTKSTDYRDNLELEVPHVEPKPKFQPETSKPVLEEYDEPKQGFKTNYERGQTNYKDTTEESSAVQNGRQFPTSTEAKTSTFLINEQPVDKRKPSLPESLPKETYETSYDKPSLPENLPKETYETSYDDKELDPPEDKPFKPSPILIKVPIRTKYANPIDNADEEEFRPVSNRPQASLRQNNKPNTYQEPRTTEKPNIPERNPLDITENEYDVTLNDALNPTIPNLPIRNFPTGFNTATDYSFTSFHRPRYDVTLNQASENRYQVRAPSQRVETVVQPYVNAAGKQYVNSNSQYNIASDQIYQNQNFRSSPQITQAQTHAFYNVY